MSASWPSQPVGPEQSASPSEFLVAAELYVSTAASLALRKPQTLRKKPVKRAAPQQSNGPSEDSKKIKEKSSWIALARGSAGTGQWRSATCKLTAEEGDRCLLNIYVDESILYRTLYIHLVNHTDIRHADTSLFFRKHCLGIYCVNQRWCSPNTTEPVYLQFANSDLCNAWLALLRSYAIAEIYGRWAYPEHGGSYRMWRQVELKVMQGRNLGNTRPVDDKNESSSEFDPVDLDVSCEIHLNDVLCGRTTVKKGIGSPVWHESFTFSDLPPFETLDVLVWREKKVFKPSPLGSVCITLNNFRRGEAIEGWFPVLQSGPLASDLQVGDIQLKIRVDEEIILPSAAYSSLLNVGKIPITRVSGVDSYQTVCSRNILDWMNDFEKKLNVKTLAGQLLSIAVAKNNIVEQIQEIAYREVDGTPSSHQTLFRGNTTLTKVMELCMTWYGKAFLEASIGSVLRKLCQEKVAIEVDPVRSGKSPKDIERGVELLIIWCRKFWEQIYSVRRECPYEMRQLFETIKKLVERRYQESEVMTENRDLPWQSVSAFCFLRFIVPCNPTSPPVWSLSCEPVRRSLTLIAKVIQSLANLNASVQKEEFMRGLKDFLQESLPAMVDYLVIVSTPGKDGYRSPKSSSSGRHDRIHVVNSLRQRAPEMTKLNLEAIPMPPHLLDVPRHLAIITSAVIRNSRDYLATSHSLADKDDRLMRDLCSKCYDIEEQALHRVSQLASQMSVNQRRLNSSLLPPQGKNDGVGNLDARLLLQSPISDVPKEQTFSPRGFGRDPEPPLTPASGSRQKTRLRHFKSPSTDSITYGDNNTTSIRRPPLQQEESLVDPYDDSRKRKKGLFRILKR
ncbi:GTPase activating protein [Armillaria luteobubalina]|uniref:GTPase activating protein n=1 Tax=Armillaria luteobubalina TaxID=153913 RepID=A0AA39QPR8_9AGAR|nr:GTPase activating protein [Armillaria luteobubalina]